MTTEQELAAGLGNLEKPEKNPKKSGAVLSSAAF